MVVWVLQIGVAKYSSVSSPQQTTLCDTLACSKYLHTHSPCSIFLALAQQVYVNRVYLSSLLVFDCMYFIFCQTEVTIFIKYIRKKKRRTNTNNDVLMCVVPLSIFTGGVKELN